MRVRRMVKRLEVLKVCVQDDHSTEEPAGWVVG